MSVVFVISPPQRAAISESPIRFPIYLIVKTCDFGTFLDLVFRFALHFSSREVRVVFVFKNLESVSIPVTPMPLSFKT